MRGDPDNDLVRRAQAGDELAVSELYERYVAQIFRWHYWQTNHHRQTAEDLTQDTFLAMARGLRRFRGRSQFRTWLYVLAKRQLWRWLKHKYRDTALPLLTSVADEPDWIDPRQQHLKAQQLEQRLANLAAREAAVLRCRYLQNLSVEETARALRLSPANVRVIAHRALLRLRTIEARNESDTIGVVTYAEQLST